MQLRLEKRKEKATEHPVRRAKYALILAVAVYDAETLPNLANPINDALKLQATLLELGWQVKIATSLGFKKAEKEMKKFAGSRAKGDDDCLFAFVGHGSQINGRNYLAAANSKLDWEYDDETEFEDALKLSYLSFDDVLEAFNDARGSSSGVTVFVLDCCRTGFEAAEQTAPTSAAEPTKKGRSVDSSSTSRAPSIAKLRAASGSGPGFLNSMVIYSTASGNVADDGMTDGKPDEGGPFMGIFCEEIASGDEVSQVMKRVRKRLWEEKPDLCQIAPDESLLVEDFVFSTKREQGGEGGAAQDA